ncbi:MAG: FKBP-type peptidyl-prolyl cis-trans isomerase [Nanoarchaeota archaeon]
MKLKKGDFIEVNYIGRTKDDNKVFDLTKEEDAKKENIYHKEHRYKPIIICLGFNDIIKGLDDGLIGKELGKHKIEIKSEQGFGKKTYDLIKLVPNSIFNKEGIKPFSGLQVNIEGLIGTVRSVSGGRSLIDFNHPLSSKDLVYDVEIERIVNDLEEKLKSLLELKLGKDVKFEISDNKAVIKLSLKEELKKLLIQEIKDKIPEIKEIEFEKQPLENK